MANFQPFPGDRTTRFDTKNSRAFLRTGEVGQVQLFGGGPFNSELLVDVNDPSVASVSFVNSNRPAWLFNYSVTALRQGDCNLEARYFVALPENPTQKRIAWFTGQLYASPLEILVSDQLVEEMLSMIMPGAGSAAIDRYFQPLLNGMLANDINTHLRMAHFLAQVGHESGDMRYAEEIATGAAYENRDDLGNNQPGDGVRFKGRGLIQLTGRANYAAYGQARGRDFLTPPNNTLIATDPLLTVDVACWFWNRHGLNQPADNDDITQITRTVNGGLNGLGDRRARLDRAKRWLP
jgi:putative chitinase